MIEAVTERITKAQRSRIMAAVRSKDTEPELIVRRIVHRLGYRYRLHERTLPGTPDIVLPRLRKVIFVSGCFWHLHRCKRGRRMPVNNRLYWAEKLERNRQRDRESRKRLRRQGWAVLLLWECQIHSLSKVQLEKRLRAFLVD